MSLSLILKH